jgi:hypothetical protein
VPIVADEARTFGMANLFRQVGIYSSAGQRYEPEDIGSVLSYREALDGQILEEGNQRSRRDRQLDGCGNELQRARLRHVAVLHLLLDVRLSARWGPDLGRRRSAGARLPARRNLRAHDARRRRVCSTRTERAM